MQNQNSDYPNMEFPYKYTKNGQKKLKEKYTNQIYNESSNINNVNNQNTTQNNNIPESNNNFNLFNMLSSFIGQKNNVETMEQKNKNFDMSKLLSLFLNKDLKQTDLINMIIPMLTGNKNLPIKDLFNFNKTKTEAEVELPKKEPIKMYGYKKVE